MTATTREERRSALDEFAAAINTDVATVPTVHANALDVVHGAQAVAVKRNETAILQKLKALAAAAGSDWFYRFPVKNKKAGTTDFVEGPSVKLANDVARLYGNAEVDCRAQDFGDTWLFHARFIDLETGFSLTRPFQQRKSGGRIGGADDERRLDIAFQIGASKAIRNVVVNALQTFCDFAFDEAREALVDKIGSDLATWRSRTLARLHERQVDLARVEAVIGRTAKDWLAPDIARVIAMMKAVSDGMASIDETFPPLKPTGQQPENARSALDAFAASVELGKQQESSAGDPSPPDDGDDAPEGDVAAAAGAAKDPPSSAPAVQDLRAEAIDRFLRLAADKSASVAERLQEIDALAPAFDDRLDEFTLQQIVRTAIDVAENRIKPSEARRHLEATL